MMVETKEISELTRSNRIAMLSHISTVTVMVFFMIWESVRGQLSPVYMTIATVVGHTFDWRGDLLEKQYGTCDDQTSGFLWIFIVLHNMSFYLTDKSDLCICNSDDFCCHHLQ